MLKQHETRCVETEPDYPPFQHMCRQCGQVWNKNFNLKVLPKEAPFCKIEKSSNFFCF